MESTWSPGSSLFSIWRLSGEEPLFPDSRHIENREDLGDEVDVEPDQIHYWRWVLRTLQSTGHGNEAENINPAKTSISETNLSRKRSNIHKWVFCFAQRIFNAVTWPFRGNWQGNTRDPRVPSFDKYVFSAFSVKKGCYLSILIYNHVLRIKRFNTAIIWPKIWTHANNDSTWKRG